MNLRGTIFSDKNGMVGQESNNGLSGEFDTVLKRQGQTGWTELAMRACLGSFPIQTTMTIAVNVLKRQFGQYFRISCEPVKNSECHLRGSSIVEGFAAETEGIKYDSPPRLIF